MRLLIPDVAKLEGFLLSCGGVQFFKPSSGKGGGGGDESVVGISLPYY
ncbi:hypothetical protein [Wolbachia endosymbiont (group B) of Colias croceus]|nr:hypothetical protein [Wolbachia endosymbiont (group B) of Colias croceus]